MCYGELDEIRLHDFLAGEENFIWLRNNAEITWIDKNSILKIVELEIKESLIVHSNLILLESVLNLVLIEFRLRYLEHL